MRPRLPSITLGNRGWLALLLAVAVTFLLAAAAAPKAADAPASTAAPPVSSQPPTADASATEPPTTEDPLQPLLATLEKLEQASDAATNPEDRAKLMSEKAMLLEQIAQQASSADERSHWFRQLADMLSAAIQSGNYPEGSKRLAALVEKLQSTGADKDVVAYIRYQQLNSDYIRAVQEPGSDYATIQTTWIETLEKHIAQFGVSAATSEAILQLAMTYEFAGQLEKATSWYGRLARECPSIPAGKKAAGAITRLQCVGKKIALRGRNLVDKEVSLDTFRGKVVLVVYWATWSDSCKKEIRLLEDLAATQDPSSFQILGVNVDHRREDLTRFVQENRLSWPQLYEEGGLEGRVANELGIINVPTLFLIGKDGNVVSRDIRVADVKRELERLK